MIILGEIVEFKDEKQFKIMWYLRAPLGLKQATTAHMVLLPESDIENEHGMAEVVLTPIDPRSWGDLWKIRCRLHEKPGVVAKFLQALRKHNINILMQESATLQQDRIHFISIIADLKLYVLGGSSSDSRRANRSLTKLDSLENLLALEVIEDIQMQGAEPAVPAISVERMDTYYQAYRALEAAPTKPYNPHIINMEQFGVVSIGNDDFVEAIKRNLLGRTVHTVRSEDLQNFLLTRALLNTHTEDRYISMLFQGPRQQIINVEIIHKEEVGALAKIANVIKDLDINIIGSFNRLHNMGIRAHWNLALDIGTKDPADVVDAIKNSQDTVGLVEDVMILPPITIDRRTEL